MPKGKQVCKKFVIVVRGKDEDDIDKGFAEAVRRVKAGNITGADSNDSGGFYFDVSDEVKKSEWPAE